MAKLSDFAAIPVRQSAELTYLYRTITGDDDFKIVRYYDKLDRELALLDGVEPDIILALRMQVDGSVFPLGNINMLEDSISVQERAAAIQRASDKLEGIRRRMLGA